METRYSYPVGRRGWQSRALASLFGIAACVMLNPAKAGTHPGGPTITPEQARIAAPYVELGSLDSRPGEDLDAFVLKAGGVIHDFTRATGHEACGVLMVADDDLEGTRGPWRVRLITNRSHIACVMIEYADQGYRRLGPGIHSHPYLPEGFKVNPQDERWRKPICKPEEEQCQAMLESAPRCGDGWRIFDGEFSARDFEHGPGYLVARGRVLYQHGAEHPIRLVGNVDQPKADALDFQGDQAHRVRMSKVAVAAWQGGELEHIPAINCKENGGRGLRP